MSDEEYNTTGICNIFCNYLYNDGFIDGNNTGYQMGYNNGYKYGYDIGRNIGNTEGFYNGYNKAYIEIKIGETLNNPFTVLTFLINIISFIIMIYKTKYNNQTNINERSYLLK